MKAEKNQKVFSEMQHLRFISYVCYLRKLGSLRYHNGLEEKEEGMDPENKGIPYKREKWVETPEWW